MKDISSCRIFQPCPAELREARAGNSSKRACEVAVQAARRLIWRSVAVPLAAKWALDRVTARAVLMKSSTSVFLSNWGDVTFLFHRFRGLSSVRTFRSTKSPLRLLLRQEPPITFRHSRMGGRLGLFSGFSSLFSNCSERRCFSAASRFAPTASSVSPSGKTERIVMWSV